MPVQYKEFEGVYNREDFPKPRKQSIEAATEELNKWIESKPELNLISVETIMVPKQTGFGSSGSEFSLIRAWFS